MDWHIPYVLVVLWQNFLTLVGQNKFTSNRIPDGKGVEMTQFQETEMCPSGKLHYFHQDKSQKTTKTLGSLEEKGKNEGTRGKTTN